MTFTKKNKNIFNIFAWKFNVEIVFIVKITRAL